MKNVLIVKDGSSNSEKMNSVKDKLIELGYSVVVQDLEDSVKLNGLKFDLVFIDEQLEKTNEQ